MCGEPMALAGAQGILQFMGGQQQSKAYKAQAQAQRDAAAQIERQREVMAQNSALEKRNLQAKSDIVAGQNTAAFGAAGIDSSSGTGLDLLMANKSALRQDLSNLDFNLSEQDYQARQNVASYLHGAKVSEHAAKQTSTLNALSSILSTASSMYGINQKYKQDEAIKKALKDSQSGSNAIKLTYDFNPYGSFNNPEILQYGNRPWFKSSYFDFRNIKQY